MKASILQLDLVAGDLWNNAQSIIDAVEEQAKKGAELCLTGELALTGFIPCDYFFYPQFISHALELIPYIADRIAGFKCALLLGGIGCGEKGELYNRALFLANGQVLGFCDKKALSDREKPFFSIGDGPRLLSYNGKKYAFCLGDDYKLSLSGSPASLLCLDSEQFNVDDHGKKLSTLTALATSRQIDVFYANAEGACDGKIYAGGSFWINAAAHGTMAPRFLPQKLFIDTEKNVQNPLNPGGVSRHELIYEALQLGIRDYCHKTNQNKIILGLSGGIDSALVAVLACKALGAANVIGILMPSPFSSEHSVKDAQALAKNLGMNTYLTPIETIMTAFDKTLSLPFAAYAKDVTEENIQSRIRGDIVMAFANKLGGIALTTGNKSELAVGYCTLYGDTCGALEVIGDLYKTEVYALSKWINASFGNIIPENIITKEPSAELRAGQKDSDSLPPYDVLDGILTGLLDRREDVSQLVQQGFAREVVEKVANLIARSQFKRLQSAPVLEVHKKTYLDMPVCGKFPFAFAMPSGKA